MVKVQKPTPKTFAKAGAKESVINKMKIAKIEKKKNAVAEPAAAKKKKNVELKARMAQEAEAVKPVKIAKNEGKNKNKKKHPIEPTTPRRPLVLAPIESPTQSTATEAKARAKNKKKKAGVVADAATKVENKNSNKAQENASPLTNQQKKKAARKAYKKLQKQKKKKTANGEQEQKKKKNSTNSYEAPPFDEAKFQSIVTTENIAQIGGSLKTLLKKVLSAKKTIFSDYRYILDVSSFKIPNCPKRMVRLNLKHSMVDKDDDVVIVVPDLQRGSKVDYEPTIQHYEDMFREAGVEGLKIMPFNQLRNEYNTFEAVRKLGNTYDYFLCDGRLVKQLAGFCGKVFQKPRKTFHSVRMDNVKHLHNEIAKSLSRTAFRQLEKGDMISIPVGHHKFSMEQLAENVEFVVSQLKELLAGGWPNIRSMQLKIDIAGTPSLPLYESMSQPPSETPYVVGPREQRMLELKKEANKVLSNFSITKDARIIKLSKEQVEFKRQLKKTRETMAAEPPVDEDGDEDTVPAKKARKEEKTAVESEPKQKSVEKKAEAESAAAGDDDEEDSQDESADKKDDDEDDDEEEHDDDDDIDDELNSDDELDSDLDEGAGDDDDDAEEDDDDDGEEGDDDDEDDNDSD